MSPLLSITLFVYLEAVSGSVIPELPEQLSEETLRCCTGEEPGRAAGEREDPLGPDVRHGAQMQHLGDVSKLVIALQTL